MKSKPADSGQLRRVNGNVVQASGVVISSTPGIVGIKGSSGVYTLKFVGMTVITCAALSQASIAFMACVTSINGDTVSVNTSDTRSAAQNDVPFAFIAEVR